MSFYGNSYSYNIVESFAKIVLKNLGLKRTAVDSFPQIDNKDFFSLVDDKGSVVLEAESSKTGVTISSGNQWIKIGANHQLDGETGKKNNELCIMHGPPAANQSPIDFVLPVNIQSTLSPQVHSIIDPVTIQFGDYLAIPLIKYDNAGHVVFNADSPESVYFKMPHNPVDDLTTKFTDIDNRFSLIDKGFTFPDGTGALVFLQNQIDAIESEVDEKLLKFEADNKAAVSAELTKFKSEQLDKFKLEEIDPVKDSLEKLETIGIDKLRDAADIADTFPLYKNTITANGNKVDYAIKTCLLRLANGNETLEQFINNEYAKYEPVIS